MAIGADSRIGFVGTADEVTVVSPASVTTGSISAGSDTSTWTNDDDAREAVAVLKGTFAATAGDMEMVDLIARPLNIINTTDDQDAPTATYTHTYLGSFPIKAVTSAQVSMIEIPLPFSKTSQEIDFYVINRTAVTMSSWELWIIPVTDGPHP